MPEPDQLLEGDVSVAYRDLRGVIHQLVDIEEVGEDVLGRRWCPQSDLIVRGGGVLEAEV